MIRHYAAKKLRPVIDEPEISSYIRELPPYVLGKLSGELTRVMVNAAQQFIYEQAMIEIKRSFEESAFPKKNPS